MLWFLHYHIYEMNQPMPIQLFFSHVWDSVLIFVPSLIPPHAQKGLKLAIETFLGDQLQYCLYNDKRHPTIQRRRWMEYLLLYENEDKIIPQGLQALRY